MFGLGTPELLLVSLIVLLLFGKRLPATMNSLGTSFRSFKDGLNDDQPMIGDQSAVSK